jgi:hypothetical protein
VTAAAVLAAASLAGADPLPVVERAGDANLEPVGPHTGLTLNATLSGSTVIAADSTGDVGRGPGVSLRIGEAASRDTIVTFELTVGSMLHDHMDGSSTDLFTNNSVDLLLGGQYYVAPSLWVRGAGGLGIYTRRGLFDKEDGAAEPNTNHFGPAALFGVGLDLLRRHWFVLGLEAFTSAIVESTGVVTTSGLGLSVGYQ